jgi:hypothetical protein
MVPYRVFRQRIKLKETSEDNAVGLFKNAGAA